MNRSGNGIRDRLSSSSQRGLAAAGLVLGLWLGAQSGLSAQEAHAIKAGMTGDEVKAAWGAPVIERKAGDYTYLFFQNDCLKECGTYDLVILEKGQVVDAVVRASYHQYEGMSSSPRDRKPEFTRPGG